MYTLYRLKGERQSSVILLIALVFTFLKTVDQFPQSSFSGHSIFSNYSFGMSWLWHMLHVDSFQLQCKSVPVSRLSALAEASSASSKDWFAFLTDDPPVYTCQHVEIFFCCHMMSLSDIELVTIPDLAKLLSSQSFPTLYLRSWNAEMNVELLICFFQTIPFSDSLFGIWFLSSKSLPIPIRLESNVNIQSIISIPPPKLIMKILNSTRHGTDSWEIPLNTSF